MWHRGEVFGYFFSRRVHKRPHWIDIIIILYIPKTTVDDDRPPTTCKVYTIGTWSSVRRITTRGTDRPVYYNIVYHSDIYIHCILLYCTPSMHYILCTIILNLLCVPRARVQDRDVVGGCATPATAPDYTAPFATPQLPRWLILHARVGLCECVCVCNNIMYAIIKYSCKCATRTLTHRRVTVVGRVGENRIKYNIIYIILWPDDRIIQPGGRRVFLLFLLLFLSYHAYIFYFTRIHIMRTIVINI